MDMRPAQVLLQYFAGQLDGNESKIGGATEEFGISTAVSGSFLYFGYYVSPSTIKKASNALANKQILHITESEALQRGIR